MFRIEREEKNNSLSLGLSGRLSTIQPKNDNRGSGSVVGENGRRSRRLVWRKAMTIDTALLTVISKGTRESLVQAVLASHETIGILGNLADNCNPEEQLKMNDCYSDHKDWRTCKKEVSRRGVPTPLWLPSDCVSISLY